MTAAPPQAIVVLIGAPGAGKTKTGKRVARAIGADFVDTDRAIVAEQGATIAELFERDGEAGFRVLERAAVAAALRQRAVVSLGGGAVLDPATQRDLAGLPVVELAVSRAGIEERLAAQPEAIAKRPLLRGGLADWERLVAQRAPLYARLASVRIDTSHRPFDEVAAEVVDWLERRASRAEPERQEERR